MPGKHQHREGDIAPRLPRKPVISLDCRDHVHAGCDICDCPCHSDGRIEL